MRKIARRARDARLAVPGLRRGGVGQVARREAGASGGVPLCFSATFEISREDRIGPVRSAPPN